MTGAKNYLWHGPKNFAFVNGRGSGNILKFYSRPLKLELLVEVLELAVRQLQQLD